MAATNASSLSLIAFYNLLLAPVLTDPAATAGQREAIREMHEWYQLCLMDDSAGPHDAKTALTPIFPANLVDRRGETSFRGRLVRSLLQLLGTTGPGLTTAAFQQGVVDIQAAMGAQTTNTLQYHRQQDNKSFTDKHGAALAERLHHWCGVADDDHLPSIHRLMAACSRHQGYGILTAELQARAQASPVPLTVGSAPMTTTKTLNDLYRDYTPAGTGLVFGHGLSPFAVVCEGHPERALVVKRVQQAIMTEQGASVSLANAEMLSSTDVRMATSPQVAAKKLYGWSVHVDLFHGVNHPIAQSVRPAVMETGPALHRIHDEHLDDPATRAYPANMLLLRALPDTLDFDDARFGTLNEHIVDLIIVAFFWLLRPAEYLYSATKEGRTQVFRLRDVSVTIDNRTFATTRARLNDVNQASRVTCASLTFTDQKNAVRGETISHTANSDPFFCPCKALGRIVARFNRASASPDTQLHRHYNAFNNRWYDAKSLFVTNALRHAAKSLTEVTGILPHLLSARSLRPGGATALLCANVTSNLIQLLGRWKLDAMFRYLHAQATTHQMHLSQRMLDFDAYTFAPGTYDDADALPREAPPLIREQLAHTELYED